MRKIMKIIMTIKVQKKYQYQEYLYQEKNYLKKMNLEQKGVRKDQLQEKKE